MVFVTVKREANKDVHPVLAKHVRAGVPVAFLQNGVDIRQDFPEDCPYEVGPGL